MTWNNIWPVGNISVKANRLKGNQNTTYTETTLKVDHYFNASPAGKHKQVTLPILAAAPASGASTGTLFTMKSGAVPYTKLYFRQETGGANPGRNQGGLIQLTGFIPSATAQGYSTLPGNLLMQWGFIASSSAVTQTVTMLQSFSGGFFNVSVTPFRDDDSSPGSGFQYYVDKSTVVPGTTFNIINRSSHSYGFFWQAIGISN